MLEKKQIDDQIHGPLESHDIMLKIIAAVGAISAVQALVVARTLNLWFGPGNDAVGFLSQKREIGQLVSNSDQTYSISPLRKLKNLLARHQ